MRKPGKNRQAEGGFYLAAIGLFMIFMAVSLLIFFINIQKNIEYSAEKDIRENIERQSIHFKTVIDTQLDHLSGIAEYLGGQEELVSSDNIKLLQSLQRQTSLDRTALMDTTGIAYYDDGSQKLVRHREYYKQAMKGKRVVSDPLESLVDAETRVILGVPVERDGAVIGVLGGSYDVGTLSGLLFEDIYDGIGYAAIVTPEGEIVSLNGDERYRTISPEDNVFEYYAGKAYAGDPLLEKMKQDFASQVSGTLVLEGDREQRYLVYEPLEINDWILCYVVPTEKAQENYQFVRDQELILYAVIMAGIIFLIMIIWRTARRKEKEILVYARTDALTGCKNKQRTEEEIDRWLNTQAGSRIQAFLILDIDHFKAINDRLGHLKGDEVLRSLGTLLKKYFRETDVVGRIGGDEFVILMKDVSSEGEAIERVKWLCGEIRTMAHIEREGYQITSSMGLAFYPQHGDDFLKLYKCADEALYETKRSGRDGYTVYNP